MDVLFLHRFTWDFLCSCFRRSVQNNCLPRSTGREGRLFPGHRPAARRAPGRPDPPVVCPGFGFDKCRTKNIPRAKPGTAGRGGTGRRGGWAGRCRARAGRSGVLRGRHLVPTSRELYTTILNDPSIPGRALHAQDLQRQTGDGTFVSSKKRRVAVVPVINRLSTARCDPPSVCIGFPFVRASGESFKTVVFEGREGKRGGCLLGEPTCRHPVLPRPAPPRPAAHRAPGVSKTTGGMSGFWNRQVA